MQLPAPPTLGLVQVEGMALFDCQSIRLSLVWRNVPLTSDGQDWDLVVETKTKTIE